MIAAGVALRSRASGDGRKAHSRLVIDATMRPNRTAPAYHVRSRRTSSKRRLIFTAIALAIVVLALGGWAIRALRAVT